MIKKGYGDGKATPKPKIKITITKFQINFNQPMSK
jgi:hypothetical protein